MPGMISVPCYFICLAKAFTCLPLLRYQNIYEHTAILTTLRQGRWITWVILGQKFEAERVVAQVSQALFQQKVFNDHFCINQQLTPFPKYPSVSQAFMLKCHLEGFIGHEEMVEMKWCLTSSSFFGVILTAIAVKINIFHNKTSIFLFQSIILIIECPIRIYFPHCAYDHKLNFCQTKMSLNYSCLQVF